MFLWYLSVSTSLDWLDISIELQVCADRSCLLSLAALLANCSLIADCWLPVGYVDWGLVWRFTLSYVIRLNGRRTKMSFNPFPCNNWNSGIETVYETAIMKTWSNAIHLIEHYTFLLIRFLWFHLGFRCTGSSPSVSSALHPLVSTAHTHLHQKIKLDQKMLSNQDETKKTYINNPANTDDYQTDIWVKGTESSISFGFIKPIV